MKVREFGGLYLMRNKIVNYSFSYVKNTGGSEMLERSIMLLNV